MPPRSTWKGYLKVSLVVVPVKAYTASSSGGGQIHLNQLHESCHRRIRYQKTCPEHGEIGNDQIVSGYEYSKGQYVVVDTSELEKLRSESDKSINVENFVHAGTIDPVYFSGKSYYLVPDGPVGQRPYALLQQTMANENLQAVAQVVLSGREQLVLVRPLHGLLTMSVLVYESQIKQPSSFKDELVELELNDQEMNLTRQLISALVDEDFDLGRYTDKYVEKLTQLIESKVEGKELVSPPDDEAPHVINLMDALKESVQRIRAPEMKKATQTPPSKMAASKPKRVAKKAGQKKRKKTG